MHLADFSGISELVSMVRMCSGQRPMSAEVLAPLWLHHCTDSDIVHIHSFVSAIVYHMFVLYFHIPLLLSFLELLGETSCECELDWDFYHAGH
jgi:hypothetical protein